MKWGVTHNPSGGGSGSRSRASEDAKAVAVATRKIETHGTNALSNKELQNVISRMNLENQYHKLTTENNDYLDHGLAASKKVLKIGKTIEEARKFLETPTGQAVKTGVLASLTAIKVAAAFKTGGASAAATKGASIVIRKAANHYTNVGN
jgi:hypothetical protein